jgi:hypothetical protein
MARLPSDDVPKLVDPVLPRVPQYHFRESRQNLLFRFGIARSLSELRDVCFRGWPHGVFCLSHQPFITTEN